MRTLKSLYAEFSVLATVRNAGVKPPSEDEVARAGSSLGFSIPKDFIDFQSLFYDRKPPFWDVLRVQPAGAPTVSYDIVDYNLELRKLYPGELDRCLLFRNIGTGDYDCFVFSTTGTLLGIGFWEHDLDERTEYSPSVLYADWLEWFESEMELLRDG